MNKILLLIAASCLSGLIGCAAPGERDLPPVIEGGYPDTDSDQAYPEDHEGADILAPQDQPPAQVQPSTSPAVVSLINQSRAQYNARNYQAAIATAERGLRIDRRSAELYLLLAQSYVQLARPQQAEQFAQQGLRYSIAGSSIAQALQRVSEIVKGAGL